MEAVGIPLLAIALVYELNKYPIQLSPSASLDFAGRIINLHQFLAHLLVVVKYCNLYSPAMFGGNDVQSAWDFSAATILDYVGFLAIFSRLPRVPYALKSMANFHIGTVIINLLDSEVFQRVFIRPTPFAFWNGARVLFVIGDALTRGYYHFVVGINGRYHSIGMAR